VTEAIVDRLRDPTMPHGASAVVRSERPEIVPEITETQLAAWAPTPDLQRLLTGAGLSSYIGVPLNVRGRTRGAITFFCTKSGHRYDSTDLAVAEDLASRAAIALENAQLYRELKDADRRKDEFLATLAHELRNPLAPIRSGLEVLRLSGSQAPTVTDARAIMERQLSHMVRLVDDLLDVSRITRDKLELRTEPIELSAVLQNAVETSRPFIDRDGHVLTMTLPPVPVCLEADPVRLAQAFSNLLNNSAKYTPPGGRITVTGDCEDGHVTVRIRDTGIGIPAEALPRLFQMFSQVDRNMGRAGGGLGIGLMLVRRLIELHGGTVCATSDGPGCGSEFVVRLPVLAAGRKPSGVAREPAALAASRTGQRILVVDDNVDSATSLELMLQILGNETRIAHDGAEAVAIAADFQPDLILLDLGLPTLDGYEVCRQIRRQPWAASVRIVALTGWSQAEDRRRTHDAGFDEHFVKPVERSTLERLLTART
jgi:signal transduction histidine kinase